MTFDRMKLSAQTVRDNIAIMEECEEPDDAGYYLQLEHEKFVLECIEKQIPKKPINKTKCDNDTAKRFENCNIVVCPECNGRLKLKSKGKHCDKCGQALDWSDTNDR